MAFSSFLHTDSRPTDLLIHQTAMEGRELVSFISILDSGGNLVTDITENNFKISYGPEPGTITSLKDFSSAKYGTAYLFMVDISKSITKKNFDLIKKSILEWIDNLNTGDAVSIITFGEEVTVLKDFSFNRNELIEAVNSLSRTDMQTRLHDALIKAHNLSSVRDQKVPTRKAIICLTDGVNEFLEGASKTEVMNVLGNNRLPVYTIGFTENLNEEKKEGIKAMGEFARSSGGVFFDANKLSIGGAYKMAKKRIDGTYMLSSICESCNYDGTLVKLYLTASFKELVLDTAVPLQLLASKQVVDPFQRGKRSKEFPISANQAILIGVAFMLIVIFSIILFIRRKQPIATSLNEVTDLQQDDFVPSSSNNPMSFTNFSDFKTAVKLEVEMIAMSHNMNDEYALRIGKDFSVGRSSACNLTIKGQPEISGNHCTFNYSEGSLFIKDNQSTNGTFLNGVRIKDKIKVSSQDVIGLGRAEFRLLFDEAGQ